MKKPIMYGQTAKSWAAGLVDGKGNVNSSELKNIPEGYKLKVVGDFYYDGGAEAASR